MQTRSLFLYSNQKENLRFNKLCDPCLLKAFVPESLIHTSFTVLCNTYIAEGFLTA